MRKTLIIFVLWLEAVSVTKAQAKIVNKISWPPLQVNERRFYFKPFIANANFLLPANRSFVLHYQPPKPAFFCGMEDKFRDRFNIFLKLRAGNDESYMKMIKPTDK
jgi:hypothetical protein